MGDRGELFVPCLDILHCSTTITVVEMIRILEQQHQQMVQNATIGIELANKRVVQSKAQV